MSREYKFRAFDKEQSLMSYGLGIDWFMGGTGGDDMEFTNGESLPYKDFIFYRPDFVIMQWTGLKDKNKIDIYEDDWCTAEFRTKEGIQVIQGRIIMDEYMWCIDCTGCVGDDIFSINRPHNFEVIGNIYQNPELLNKNL